MGKTREQPSKKNDTLVRGHLQEGRAGHAPAGVTERGRGPTKSAMKSMEQNYLTPTPARRGGHYGKEEIFPVQAQGKKTLTEEQIVEGPWPRKCARRWVTSSSEIELKG